MTNTVRHNSGKKVWFRWGPKTKAAFIQDEMNNWAKKPTAKVRYRKPRKVYEAEVVAAKAKYDATPYENWFCDRPAFRNYVSKFYYITVDVSYEKALAYAEEEWAKRFRDGYCSETSRTTGFKKDAAKKLRRDNKRYCDDVVAGREVDHLAYPSRKESKYIVWSYW